MKLSVRDADGKLNFTRLEKSVQDFLDKNPEGVHSITELSEPELRLVVEYFGDDYAVSPRKIVKSGSGHVDYRLDIRKGEQ